MSTDPIILAKISDKAFETRGRGDTWSPGGSGSVIHINKTSHKFDEFACSFKFVAPHSFCLGDTWNLLKVAWLSDSQEQVLAELNYKPSESRISVLTCSDGDSPELDGVVIEDVSPGQLCGQVLEFYAEINPDLIFVSIHNRFTGGKLSWSAQVPYPGQFKELWKGAPSGQWTVTSGQGTVPGSNCLPPRFGLANLQVSLAAAHDTFLDSLLYEGELNHLLTTDASALLGGEVPDSSVPEDLVIPADVSELEGRAPQEPPVALEDLDSLPELDDLPEPTDSELDDLEALESASLELTDTVLEHWGAYPEDRGFKDVALAGEMPLSRMLQQLACQLHDMSGDARTWAAKAEALAEETEEVVMQLPNDFR